MSLGRSSHTPISYIYRAFDSDPIDVRAGDCQRCKLRTAQLQRRIQTAISQEEQIGLEVIGAYAALERESKVMLDLLPFIGPVSKFLLQFTFTRAKNFFT